MGTLLLFTGLTLLSFSATGDAAGSAAGGGRLDLTTADGTVRLAGIILGPFSIVVMAYALGMYLWRSRQISRRDASVRYDDRLGPTVLVVVLLFAASACVAIALSRWALPKSGAGAPPQPPAGAADALGSMSKRMPHSDGGSPSWAKALSPEKPPKQPPSGGSSGKRHQAANASDAQTAAPAGGGEKAPALQRVVTSMARAGFSTRDSPLGDSLAAGGSGGGAAARAGDPSAAAVRPPPPPPCLGPDAGLSFGPFALPTGLVRQRGTPQPCGYWGQLTENICGQRITPHRRFSRLASSSPAVPSRCSCRRPWGRTRPRGRAPARRSKHRCGCPSRSRTS